MDPMQVSMEVSRIELFSRHQAELASGFNLTGVTVEVLPVEELDDRKVAAGLYAMDVALREGNASRLEDSQAGSWELAARWHISNGGAVVRITATDEVDPSVVVQKLNEITHPSPYQSGL